MMPRRSCHRRALKGHVLIHLVRWKDKREDRPAPRVVIDGDASPMGLHDLTDDRQAQAGAITLCLRLTAPKAIEDAPAIVHRYSRPAIGDPHPPIRMHPDRDLAAR